MGRSRALVAGALFGAALMVAGACADDDTALPPVDLSPGNIELASLQRFDSCDAVAERLRTATVETLATGGDLAGRGPAEFDTVGGAITADGQATAAPASGDDSVASGEAAAGSGGAELPFSTTNVQEEGVDEPDTVKTDGSTLFVLRDNVVRVLRAGDLAELSTIEVGDANSQTYASQLLLDGDRLLVLGSASGPLTGAEADQREIYQPTTVLTRYDVSNPAAPALIDRASVDGEMVSARMVAGVARVVVRDGGGYIGLPEPLAGDDAAAWSERVATAVADEPAETFLPSFAVVDAGGDVTVEGPAVACDQVFAPPYETGPSTITVHTLDLDGGLDPGAAVSVLAGGDIVYASTDRLYVATTQWWAGPIGIAVDGIGVAEPAPAETPAGESLQPLVDEGVVEILPSDPDEPVSSEPGGAGGDDPVEPPVTAQPVEPPEITSELHAFSIEGDGAATYLGSGQVRGTVLNQFSMSQLDEVLRVATTVDVTTSGTSESFVTTFTLEGDELRPLGQVGGLGRGERIYAVRFLGDVGYVVTFRQVDPLYAIDLSDPANPVVRGELKIEGYSAYLHPVNQDRLIGLGQDATTEGQTLGTQMSLFDVSNLDAPARLSQVGFGQSSNSTAEHDHHAFLYWAPEGLVVVPLQEWSFDPATGTETGFAGAVLVRLAGDGLSEIGRITHPTPSAGDPRAPEFIHYGGIERSLVVGDQLYTVSPLGVAATDLDSLRQTAFAPFPVAQPGDVIYEVPVAVPEGD